MQGEFEKHVQQKMESLRLVPSEPVWDKVEMAIRNEKYKRRFLFFLLFTLLIGAGSVWYFIDTNKSTTLQSAAIPANVPSIPKATGAVIPPSLKAKTLIANKPGSYSKKSLFTEIKAPVNKQSPKLFSTSSIFTKMHDKEVEASVIVPVAPLADTSVTLKEVTNPGQQNEVLIQDSTAKSLQNDTVAKAPFDKQAVSAPIENISKQPAKKQAANKWQKIVYLQVGSSSFKEKMFSTGTIAYADPGSLSNSQSGGRNTITVPQTSPALSYGVGVGVVKSINKRWQLAAAIQYQYYSTHTKTGAHFNQDTTAVYSSSTIYVQEYFTNSRINTYTNKISLVQFNPSIRYVLSNAIPLKLDVGMSYGLLIKSTALTYDWNNNIYYLNKDNNLNDLLQLTSSFEYEFGSKTKIIVAPVFQYSLTKLQRYSYGSSAHLSFWGLRSGIKF